MKQVLTQKRITLNFAVTALMLVVLILEGIQLFGQKAYAADGRDTVKVGSFVTYGAYPQTAAGDDNTPVEWIVLDVQDNKALLISRYGLDAQLYNTDHVDVTWENCTLRTWLNDTFLNRAFSAEEQKAILTTTVDNSYTQCFGGYVRTSGGNNTQDRIFLLSYGEANKYFEVTSLNYNMQSRIEPTEYALKNGAGLWSDFGTANGNASGCWWLRSPGYNQNKAAIVYADGCLDDQYVYRNSCIRPAFWIDLESGAIMNEKKVENTVEAGSYVTYGGWPQTAGGYDNSPIEWLVLDVQDGKALLISRYGLEAQRYNDEYEDVTWESCTLRAWLNDTFLNEAFSESEQKAILTTTVDNSESQCYGGWGTTGGNNTQDRIFLLSYAEANMYLGVEYWQVDGAAQNVRSRVQPTDHAIKSGVYTNSFYTTEDGKATVWWWLRSPGYSQHSAAGVDADGSLSRNYVDYFACCIRPAFWISLE